MDDEIILGVSDFVALLNQSLEYAFPNVVITGELANLRVSKNKWLYFDLKDERSSVKFFGTVYMLPGPLEDGMILKVRGQPRLHNLYGFSINVQNIQPAGEGTIKRAAELLLAKLTTEGLFDETRKRLLPYPPRRIGLIASKQSAAYADFMKIIDARWRGMSVDVIDVQVQGEPAPGQIVAAIDQFNVEAELPDVLVLIRGGGSPEDLAAFSTEQVTRAVAGSRIPTLVAIGHEVDVSLAELAADRRASTPSNAAELLTPDRQHVVKELGTAADQLRLYGEARFKLARQTLTDSRDLLRQFIQSQLEQQATQLASQQRLLTALSPRAILRRGYAIVRSEGTALRSIGPIKVATGIEVELADGSLDATVTNIKKGKL
jgi:exodeoxyribonuclease VII large subunit